MYKKLFASFLMLGILSLINDEGTAHAAEIERSFSFKMGGGCKSPTGAYAFRDGNDFHFIGMVEAPDGSILRQSASAPLDKSQHLGEMLAETLLQELNRHG